MFEAIVPATPLIDWLESVRALVSECRIHISEDGFETAAVDPSNVAMVWAELDSSQFDYYDGGRGTIGVNLDRFDEVLDFASEGDVIHLSMDEERWRLEVQVNHYDWTIACIDPDAIRAEPDMPELDLPAQWTVRGKEFHNAKKAVDTVTDHIVFDADPDSEEIVVKGRGDTDDVDVHWDEEIVDTADVPEAAQSMYSIEFVKDMVAPIPKSAPVSFELGTEFPVLWRYEPTDGVSVENMLAPRIQAEGY